MSSQRPMSPQTARDRLSMASEAAIEMCLASAHPEMASCGPARCSHSAEILDAALLRLRFNLAAALIMTAIYHFWMDTN
jgi:hypothetical protein